MEGHHPIVDFFADLRFSQRTEDRIPEGLQLPDMATAYTCQEALVARLIARHGGDRSGYKIACTNAIAQQMLNVDAPVYGRLMSSAIHPSPARFKASGFMIIGIEAEFAFEMGQMSRQRIGPTRRRRSRRILGVPFPPSRSSITASVIGTGTMPCR